MSIPELCPDIDPTTLNTEIMQNDNTTRPGRTVLYACSPRYRHVSGDLIRRCRKDGSWSGTAPVCEGKYRLTVFLSDLPLYSGISLPLVRKLFFYKIYRHAR